MNSLHVLICVLLNECSVKATFFLLGMQIANRESIVEAMIAQGHNIGSHSWDHPHFNANTTNIVQQLERTRYEFWLILYRLGWLISQLLVCRSVSGRAEIFRAVGRNVTDFRPPFGECNRLVFACNVVILALFV